MTFFFKCKNRNNVVCMGQIKCQYYLRVLSELSWSPRYSIHWFRAFVTCHLFPIFWTPSRRGTSPRRPETRVHPGMSPDGGHARDALRPGCIRACPRMGDMLGTATILGRPWVVPHYGLLTLARPTPSMGCRRARMAHSELRCRSWY